MCGPGSGCPPPQWFSWRGCLSKLNAAATVVAVVSVALRLFPPKEHPRSVDAAGCLVLALARHFLLGIPCSAILARQPWLVLCQSLSIELPWVSALVVLVLAARRHSGFVARMSLENERSHHGGCRGICCSSVVPPEGASAIGRCRGLFGACWLVVVLMPIVVDRLPWVSALVELISRWPPGVLGMFGSMDGWFIIALGQRSVDAVVEGSDLGLLCTDFRRSCS